jgi:serine phosphatase RsbU (regulator of sigma subunit)
VRETDNGSALRPVDWAQFDGVDICAKHHAKCLGGDFFDGLVLADRILFLLSDIAGPRSEALRVAVEVQTVFREKAAALFTPMGVDGSEINESDAMAELANAVNRSLIDTAGGRTHLAPTFIGCFQQSLGILTYCNAGNVFALAREGQAVRHLESSGMPLGLFSHLTFEAMIFALQRGEALLVVTKGVAESRRRREEFGDKRLAGMFEHSSEKSAAAICDEVLQAAYDFGTGTLGRVLDHVNAGRREDLTALALVRRA